MSETVETPRAITATRGEGLSEPTLIEPCRVLQDTRLVARAVKERWRVPDGKRDGIVERLLGIVDKTHLDVVTKFGLEAMEGPADVNAIAAARVIVAMEGQNQEDERPANVPTVAVGIAVNGVTPAQVAAELLMSGEWRQLECSHTSNAS